MKYLRYIFPLILLFAIQAEPAPSPDDFNELFISASRQARKSVVTIIVYSSKRENGKTVLRRVAFGSGTILNRKGLVVTNHHVLLKGNYYRIITHSGTEYETRPFEGSRDYLADPKTDIALLRMDSDGREHFHPVEMADSNNLIQGEWVLAIGNPYGLRLTITSGIVSSQGRDNIGFVSIEDFIQSDVSINPGNSGGPLVNLYGRMVGLNTAIRTSTGGFQGISFSIPSNIVRHVVKDLLRYGRVRRGWLGLIAREEHTPSGKSQVTILSVLRNSPAQDAGLRKGDIIRKLNGIEIENLGRLMKLVGNRPVGSRITLEVSRNGRLIRHNLILREKKDYRQIKSTLARLITIYGIDIDEDTRNNRPVVSYVSPRSIHLGLRQGDVLLRCNGKPVPDLDSLTRVFRRDGNRLLSLKVMRNGRVIDIPIP
jgi:S1-C subfamily serine protease